MKNQLQTCFPATDFASHVNWLKGREERQPIPDAKSESDQKCTQLGIQWKYRVRYFPCQFVNEAHFYSQFRITDLKKQRKLLSKWQKELA